MVKTVDSVTGPRCKSDRSKESLRAVCVTAKIQRERDGDGADLSQGREIASEEEEAWTLLVGTTLNITLA